MERYFIIVVQNPVIENTLGKLQKEFDSLSKYQKVIASRETTDSAFPPKNQSSINWAVCVTLNQLVYKGVGSDTFKNFILHKLAINYPSEIWDSKTFSSISNHAIDIFLYTEEKCLEFWKSFNPSNCIKIFRNEDDSVNPQLFWRGSIRMKDPINHSSFKQLENAELSYDFDNLDLLIDQVINTNLQPSVKQMKTFCPYLELVGAFNATCMPFIFYSTTCFNLSVPAESFWKSMDENISFLFRLDYTMEGVNNVLGKEVGTHSINFLSHFINDEIKLYVMKNVDEVQNLANVFVTVNSTEFNVKRKHCLQPFKHHFSIPSEREVRRMQLIALQTWIEERGEIDEFTMTTILDEVAVAITKKSMPEEISEFTEEISDIVLPSFNFFEDDVLKWKLEKKHSTIELDRPTGKHGLLKPNGNTVTVDISQIIRCFSKNSQTRSPKKVRDENCRPVSSQLKPTTDFLTASTTEWPQCTKLKYHGINYNLSFDDEKAEKLRAEYQDKWVTTDSTSWCNPWSFHTSTTFQLSQHHHAAPRTPRKNLPRDNALPRKSPRLLAKNEPRPRRTPSKKNVAPNRPIPSKDNFKQQLKAIIIRVLSEHKINTKDPLFRTCANKLSVICMALLKDSKNVATSRQMYQVAKSHAKQVVQFIKQ